MFDAKPILKTLPNLPGVYRMLNASDEVIYVGKAKDLKKRVSSYFNKNLPSPRTRLMVSHIANIVPTLTQNVLSSFRKSATAFAQFLLRSQRA